MTGQPTLVMAGTDHHRLKDHLLPGDGREAAAILLCARGRLEPIRLLVKHVHLVSHADCDRRDNHLVWPGQCIEDCLTLAEDDDLSLVLVHSHPSGYDQFSSADDESDREVMPSMFLARLSNASGSMFHGSAIMLPGGAMRARVYDEQLRCQDARLVSVIGDDISFFWPDGPNTKRPLAFSSGMTNELRRLHAGIVGASGTGSIVSEQALRLGFGEITIVDHDVMERRNLNRILNSTFEDAILQQKKVRVFERAARAVNPDVIVNTLDCRASTRKAIEALSQADVLFCCVDTETGRDICDRLAAAMLLPLFDVGVVIPVRRNVAGELVIQDVQGRIDYIQPGESSLLSRGVYTSAGVAAEDLRERDPDAFERQVSEGYMPGMMEEAPSVITLNMRGASMVMQEFIARAYPYRLDGNRPYAQTSFALAIEEQDFYDETHFPRAGRHRFAAGLRSPLLGIPALEDAQ